MYDVPIGPLEWDYTCKFGGGGVKARLRQLTSEEEDACYDYTGGDVRVNKSRYVRLGVVRIDGLSVGGEPVTTGEALCKARGLFVLLNELFVQIYNGSTLTEDEVKN
jgi:hypothetical protein